MQYPSVIIGNQSLDISKTVFKTFSSPRVGHKHCIFVDGMYLIVHRRETSCIAGVVVDEDSQEVIAEFVSPLKTRDNLNQRIKPAFELLAIKMGMEVAFMLNLHGATIKNDSYTDIGKFNDEKKLKKALSPKEREVITQLNIDFQWIPRQDNLLADHLTQAFKQQWFQDNKEYVQAFHRFPMTQEVNSVYTVIFFQYSHMRNGIRSFYDCAALENNQAQELLLLKINRRLNENQNALIELATQLLASKALDYLGEDINFLLDKKIANVIIQHRRIPETQQPAYSLLFDLCQNYPHEVGFKDDSQRRLASSGFFLQKIKDLNACNYFETHDAWVADKPRSRYCLR